MKCVGPTLARHEIAAVRKSLEFAPELEEAAELFNLASNSTRLKILFLLDRLRELCVCDLAEMLGVSVSAVSQHLAKFRAYGLATTRRDGQTIFYRLSDHEFLSRLRGTFLAEMEPAFLAEGPTRHGAELPASGRAGGPRRRTIRRARRK